MARALRSAPRVIASPVWSWCAMPRLRLHVRELLSDGASLSLLGRAHWPFMDGCNDKILTGCMPWTDLNGMQLRKDET